MIEMVLPKIRFVSPTRKWLSRFGPSRQMPVRWSRVMVVCTESAKTLSESNAPEKSRGLFVYPMPHSNNVTFPKYRAARHHIPSQPPTYELYKVAKLIQGVLDSTYCKHGLSRRDHSSCNPSPKVSQIDHAYTINGRFCS